jgi:hypothetical protein
MKKDTLKTSPHRDPATYYQESPFPGRRLLAWAIAIWAIVILLPSWILNFDQLPHWTSYVQLSLFIPAIVLYFIGFWRAVVGKGYPKILFLMAFVPPIGLIILLFLPLKGANSSSDKITK